MRRVVPYFLVVALTSFAGIAAISSASTPARDEFGLLPTNSIPWGSISSGWMMGHLSPRNATGEASASSDPYFLFSPSGERYRLSITPSDSTRMLAWSGDGRYVATLDVNAAGQKLPRRLAVRDLRTWRVVSHLEFRSPSDDALAIREPYISSAAFSGPGRHELLVTFSNVDPINGSGAYTPPSSSSQLLDVSHFVARRIGERVDSVDVAQPRPDGTVVATGGLSIARLTAHGWSTTSLGDGSCTLVKWWSPSAILAACELRGLEGHDQLFAYNISDGTRTAVSPVPGTLFSDADRGNRSWAWAYGDAFRLKGRDFVHAIPTCGPGWVETVRDGMGHVLRGTGGSILGATRDALILDVVRGECMGNWAIVQLDAETLHRRTLLTSREWAGRDVTWVLIQHRYGDLDQ